LYLITKTYVFNGNFLCLTEIAFRLNEIGARGGLELGNAVRNKEKLTPLDVDGNLFGETGRQELQSELKDQWKVEGTWQSEVS